MKKTLLTLCMALAAAVASAAIWETQIVSTPNTLPCPVKVTEAHVLSSVADGTATVKAVRRLYADEDVVTELAPVTNLSYRLVYNDGANVVTNDTPYDVDFRYIGTNYVSYATNAVVTVTAVTNTVRALKLCVTNEVLSVTCSGGVGEGSPSETTLLESGVELFYSGTARGDVRLILER